MGEVLPSDVQQKVQGVQQFYISLKSQATKEKALSGLCIILIGTNKSKQRSCNEFMVILLSFPLLTLRVSKISGK